MELAKARNIVGRHITSSIPPDLPVGTLERCLAESWFSNTLAWLLDSHGSHGLGTSFGELFLQRIARIRTDGALRTESGSRIEYARRNTHFKFGKGGAGVSALNHSLRNASALREFYLTRDGSRKGRFCDVVYFDLDSGDSFFVVIEVKLFTTSHSGQLLDYYDAIESKFKRIRVREYVYLTLDGQTPKVHRKEEIRNLPHWVLMSWTADIAEILEEAAAQRTAVVDLYGVTAILATLRALGERSAEQTRALHTVWAHLTWHVRCSLRVELNRLGEDAPGTWTDPLLTADIERSSDGEHETCPPLELEVPAPRSFVLTHSSNPARPLKVVVKSNLQMVITGQRPGSDTFEHILIPFGAHPDQVQHLIHLAAREIYYHLFDRPERYLGNSRRRTKGRTDQEREAHDLYHFIWSNRVPLMILASLSGFGTAEELASDQD